MIATARTLVLDDDPTGTQCTADLDILLDTQLGSSGYASLELPTFLRSEDTAAHLLTNTRALSADAAGRLVSDIRARCAVQAPDVRLILRGDSTLRGHVLVELQALGLSHGVALVVPAFPAAGRVTVGGEHRVRIGDAMVNAADTEFARDPVFGYVARDMRSWVAEVAPGHEFVGVPLEVLRAQGAERLREVLTTASPGSIVMPDAETDGDLQLIATGFGLAMAACSHVVLRCSAPLAALVTGLPGRVVSPERAAAGHTLVVCGSHTSASTRQLAQLTARHGAALMLDTDVLLGPDWSGEAQRVAELARSRLAAGALAVIASERVRRPDHGSLEIGAAVMRGVVALVRELRGEVDSVVAKGGITSAEVAGAGLGASRARVLGQLETGVSLWSLGPPSGPWSMAVVPGNIGDDGILVRVVERFLGGDPNA